MGQKTHPISFRLGIIKTWTSTWFHDKKYADYLLEDIAIRKLVESKLKEAGIAQVGIERSEKETRINIFTSRPGVIIGRGGTGIEELRAFIKKHIPSAAEFKINIEEIRDPNANARLLGQMVAEQLEKRVAFRRALKQAIERATQSSAVKGVKIMVSGRLNGAEMSRREWLAKGKMPLHTLRADIDFARVKAQTTYGAIGVKVWIYKGEVFDQAQKQQAAAPQAQQKPRN